MCVEKHSSHASEPMVFNDTCARHGMTLFPCLRVSVRGCVSSAVVEFVYIHCRVLESVPESRLCLKSNVAFSMPHISELWYKKFEDRGISRERIILVGFMTGQDGHLGAYHKVDIALDAFPYGGTTTISEVLSNARIVMFVVPVFSKVCCTLFVWRRASMATFIIPLRRVWLSEAGDGDGCTCGYLGCAKRPTTARLECWDEYEHYYGPG